ncbi:MAG: dihydroorotate dehydrogenase [Candidatus Omnitrophota bacterium]|nr:dihydroorotate dehydrogenase [Candidatus Omnitrophota bacterium]
MNPKLTINIGKLRLKNPVMVASGTFGYAEEFMNFINLRELGAIVTKTITLKPRKGNLPPRTCETPAGMLNSIGLENPGLEVFIKEKLPILKKIGVPIIVSISSEEDSREFVQLAKALGKIKEVAAIELNISCPNIKSLQSTVHGQQKRNLSCGLSTIDHRLISQDPDVTYAVVSSVRSVTKKTLITKLSPNVTCISDIALACEKAGSDALALINTLYGMSIDVQTKRPKLSAGIGGLSGPAIRPIALKMVWETYKKVKIPIIGMGGIMDTQSALEFIIAGASAISIGTANFINPAASIEIINGIEKYLQKKKINSVKELIGTIECRI